MARWALTGSGVEFRLRWIAALVALLWVGACQSAGDPPSVPTPDGWRVVERLGHARFQPPGATEWLHVPAAGLVPDGSRVVTGRGGRLILADAGRQVVASTACEFRLPYGGDPAWLQQSAGPVRYRVLDGAALIVETPFFEADVARGVFDVSVGPAGAEIRVTDGRARIITPDGRTGTTLEAGQSASAERRGREYLLGRRDAGGAFEGVAPDIRLATESAGTAAKLSAPQARLLAEAAVPHEDEIALGSVLPQQVAVAVDAVAVPSPPRLALAAGVPSAAAPQSATELVPARTPREPTLMAQLAPPQPSRRLIAPAPARPGDQADRSAGEAADTRSAIERWSELATKRADYVIVPARYPKTPAGDETGSAGEPSPSGEVRRATGAGGGSPKDERQIPFDRLGAGLLDGLPPAEIRTHAAPQVVPARRL